MLLLYTLQPFMYSSGRMDMLRMRGGVRIRPLYLATSLARTNHVLIDRLCGS